MYSNPAKDCMPKKKTTALVVSPQLIVNRIYFIRGQSVLLDEDLAELQEFRRKYSIRPLSGIWITSPTTLLSSWVAKSGSS